MILTVTLNTSIDKLYLVESIHPETVMRVKEVHNTAGGKGTTISIGLSPAAPANSGTMESSGTRT